MGGDIHFEWGIRALTFFQLCNCTLFLGGCNPVEIGQCWSGCKAILPCWFSLAVHSPLSSSLSLTSSLSPRCTWLIFWILLDHFQCFWLCLFDILGSLAGSLISVQCCALAVFWLGRHNHCWCWCGVGVGVVKGWGNKQRAGHSKSRVDKLMIKPIFFYSKIMAVWCSWLEHMCYDDVWGLNFS